MAAVTRPAAVVPHDADWGARAQGEALRLQKLAGHVEHIGSTAVPGLAGLAAIDLMVGARMLDQRAEQIVASLLALGYRRRRTVPTAPGTILLDKKDGAFTIHLVELYGGQWRSNLAVRDYLREFSDEAVGYDRARREAVARAATVTEYRKLMRPTVENLARRATRWRLAHPRS